MADERALKCLIAAGGTAGHVLPSLAVGEALVGRGVKVTFAGSPDRVAARLAKRVFLAFPIEGREGEKYRVTGRPIPARNRPTSRAEGRRVFELPPRARVLLVFGGSLGAASLNDLAVESFGEVGPAVLH